MPFTSLIRLMSLKLIDRFPPELHSFDSVDKPDGLLQLEAGVVLQQLQELTLVPPYHAGEPADWDWREHYEFSLPPSLSSLHSTLTALKFEGEWSGILPPTLPHLTGLQRHACEGSTCH